MTGAAERSGCGAPLRFGTAGVPRSLSGASHLDGIAEVRRLGLQAMELAFVHRVNVRPDQAPDVQAQAHRLDVALSAHASYYINLNSPSADKVKASRYRVLQAARVGYLCGADTVVFHAGWRHDDAPERVYQVVRSHVAEMSHILREEGVHICLRPETTGKQAQFGDLDELLRLAQDVPGVRPCLDFAHLHARQGLMNTEDEFEQVLQRMGQALGSEALQDVHIHVSGIEYGARGEIRHVPLPESDLNYRGLLGVLARLRVSGRVICESPTNDQDAVLLWHTWLRIRSDQC
ncbi:MAG: TIM barrel protein [Anaerolineae bacterium]|nr:TIM barrel protein [Anaerolineae bacterium]